MLNIGEKHYQQFNPHERINLTMAALARNDIKEADHLWDTCPTYSYRMRDLEYSARFFDIVLIGSFFFENCVLHYNTIKRADEFIASIENEFENPLDVEKILEKVFFARAVHITRLKALYQGLIQFCQHTGINYDDFIKTIPINKVCFEIEHLLSAEIKVDNILVEQMKKMFLEYWHP